MGAWRNRRDGLSFVSRRDCLGVCVTTLAVGAPVQPLHVFAWIVDSGLQDSLKALAHALLRRVDRGSWRWPKRHGAPGGVTVADLADGAGLSRRHAARCLRVLEDQGLVRTTFRPFEVSEYQLVVHGWQQRAEAHRAARKQAKRETRAARIAAFNARRSARARPEPRPRCAALRRPAARLRPPHRPPALCRPGRAATHSAYRPPRRPSSTSSEEPRPRFLATSTPAARAVSPDRYCGCGTAGDGRHLLCSRPSSPWSRAGPKRPCTPKPSSSVDRLVAPQVQTALAMPGRSATPTDLSSACSSRAATTPPSSRLRFPPSLEPHTPESPPFPGVAPRRGCPRVSLRSFPGSGREPNHSWMRGEKHSLVFAGARSMIGAPSTSSCLRCGRWAFEMGWWCWRLRARTLPGGLDATSQTSLPSCRGAWALRWAWSSTSRRPASAVLLAS